MEICLGKETGFLFSFLFIVLVFFIGFILPLFWTLKGAKANKIKVYLSFEMVWNGAFYTQLIIYVRCLSWTRHGDSEFFCFSFSHFCRIFVICLVCCCLHRHLLFFLIFSSGNLEASEQLLMFVSQNAHTPPCFSYALKYRWWKKYGVFSWCPFFIMGNLWCWIRLALCVLLCHCRSKHFFIVQIQAEWWFWFWWMKICVLQNNWEQEHSS